MLKQIWADCMWLWCRHVYVHAEECVLLVLSFITSWSVMKGIVLLGHSHGDRSTDHQCLPGVPLPARPSGGAGTAQRPRSGEKAGCRGREVMRETWHVELLANGSGIQVTCCTIKMRFSGACEFDGHGHVSGYVLEGNLCLWFHIIQTENQRVTTSSPAAHLSWHGECKSGEWLEGNATVW